MFFFYSVSISKLVVTTRSLSLQYSELSLFFLSSPHMSPPTHKCQFSLLSISRIYLFAQFSLFVYRISVYCLTLELFLRVALHLSGQVSLCLHMRNLSGALARCHVDTFKFTLSPCTLKWFATAAPPPPPAAVHDRQAIRLHKVLMACVLLASTSSSPFPSRVLSRLTSRASACAPRSLADRCGAGAQSTHTETGRPDETALCSCVPCVHCVFTQDLNTLC